MSKSLFLVDVSSMFFRAFYAIPPLSNTAGLPTNALYGFLNMTIKLLRDNPSEYIAYCFDRKEGSFRTDIDPNYKANRTEMPEDLAQQIPYIRRLTETLGIPIFDKLGFEADDVIGSLATFGLAHKLEVVIVSGDKDFAQLVEPNLILYDTMKNKKIDVQGVIEKWGVEPGQMIDYLSLIGDSSDNIPGVKGVGPKGAQKLLAEHKNLDTIYDHVDEISAKGLREKMKLGKESAYLAKRLVTIVTDIDFGVEPNLKQLKLQPVNQAELTKSLEELEFEALANKLNQRAGTASSETSTLSAPSDSKKKPAEKNKSGKAKAEKTKASVSAEIKGVAWSFTDLDKNLKAYDEVWVIESPIGFLIGKDESVTRLDESIEPAKLGALLQQKKLKWRGYDLKHTWSELNITEPQEVLWDQMLAAYIIRPGVIGEFSKTYETHLGKLVPDLASPTQIYECHMELESTLLKKLEKCHGVEINQNLDLPFLKSLYSMEKHGVLIDPSVLKEQDKELTQDLTRLEKEIYEVTGETFNILSPKQLGEILFTKMGLPPGKKTKTGYSTNSDVLTKLADDHPICNMVLEFREINKLRSTYVQALMELVGENEGRVHSHFRQAHTTTGRLSSANPNLQNIPIRTERGRKVRKAFVAPKQTQILSADYSQIELRVLAHITKDPGLIEAFSKGQDIHAATAAEVFGVPIEKVSSELRRKAKAVNFGIAYGQGAFGLAESLGISRKESKEIIDNYFKRFKKVRDYMTETVEQATESGFVESLFGRRRYIDELKSSSAMQRKFGERAAINAPIQGTSSDIIKMAMIQLDQELDIPMILQVHDELLFECPDDELEDQAVEIRSIMEGVVDWDVPMVVNIAWGRTWEEAHM